MQFQVHLRLSSVIFATLLVVPFSLFADLEDGLIGYYSMEEGKDKALRDSSGSGNHGQIFTAKRTKKGKFGSGLFFDD